jgi:hypothetical protein
LKGGGGMMVRRHVVSENASKEQQLGKRETETPTNKKIKEEQ